MKDETRSFYESAVRRAVALVYGQLDEALDLAALARTAALSPLHFHRIFRWMIGETPLELHRRLRLERAAHELSSSDVAVTRVAFGAGYETHESFTRAFNERYGVSPSAFRQGATQARASSARSPKIELAAPSGIHFREGRDAEIANSLTKGKSAMHVDFKNLPELRVAAVHHTGPYNRISEAFGKLGDIAGPAGLIRPPATEMLAVYYDDPESTPVDQLRSDAGLTVPSGVALPDGLSEVRIPAARYAFTTYVGPYTGLGDAWARLLGEWLPESGERALDGPSFEIYRNTPMNAAPHELRTELYVPIA